ncbi:hypothetical protein F4778DRAFT_701578 [Xylariomycetidae sp. FL2044]|nr:hypothetical protein F4778DRAFT_701578 [Xylariomycetidae sp. FL2044]
MNGSNKYSCTRRKKTRFDRDVATHTLGGSAKAGASYVAYFGITGAVLAFFSLLSSFPFPLGEIMIIVYSHNQGGEKNKKAQEMRQV